MVEVEPALAAELAEVDGQVLVVGELGFAATFCVVVESGDDDLVVFPLKSRAAARECGSDEVTAPGRHRPRRRAVRGGCAAKDAPPVTIEVGELPPAFAFAPA